MHSSQSGVKPEQAYRFADAFGYNPNYLIRGQGSLEGHPRRDVRIRHFNELRQTALVEIATNIISYSGNATAVRAWEAINSGDVERYQIEISSLIHESGKVLLPGRDAMLVAKIASVKNYDELIDVFGAPMDADVIKRLSGKEPSNADI